MNKKVLTLIVLILSSICFESKIYAGKGTAAFGGALAGLTIGSIVANRKRPREVVVVEESNSYSDRKRIRRAERNLKNWERDLERTERELSKIENKLAKVEKDLANKEDELDEREDELNQQEKDLNKKEKDLKKREASIKSREKKLNK